MLYLEVDPYVGAPDLHLRVTLPSSSANGYELELECAFPFVLGGLGLLFAREILERTREAHVVLTGRSAFRPEKQNLLDESAGHSRRLSYRQVDLGSLDQVGRLIAGIKGEYGQLAGILHCAGMIADNFILKKSAAQFSEVLGPKVTGTFNLDQASRNLELDFFVLFSSIAGAIGNVGQADYATANGFMDQFAAYRNRLVATKQRRESAANCFS